MPRKPRNVLTGHPHHVVNRGVERRVLFREGRDYEFFLHLLAIGKQLHAVKVFAITLMPNHFHAVMQPESDGALSEYLRLVLGSYASAFRSRTGTKGNGHVFQNRFWSDPIDGLIHFLRVLRYVEANPLRAEMVARAEAWPWSSLAFRAQSISSLLDPLPVELGDEWTEFVNQQQPLSELKAIRFPKTRGRPRTSTETSGPQ